MTRSARRSRRLRLFNQQDGLCHYCAGEMRLLEVGGGPQLPEMATLEHIKQRAEGGTYDESNCKAACAACNVARPNGMAHDLYFELRRQLLAIWPPCTSIPAQARKLIQRQAPQALYRIAHGAAA